MNHIAHRDLTWWREHFEKQARFYSNPCPERVSPALWESLRLGFLAMAADISLQQERQAQATALWRQETLFTLSEDLDKS